MATRLGSTGADARERERAGAGARETPWLCAERVHRPLGVTRVSRPRHQAPDAIPARGVRRAMAGDWRAHKARDV